MTFFNPAKTASALPPKGYTPTAEEISRLVGVDVRIADDNSLLASVDVSIAEEGGVTVVGALVGTDNVRRRARGEGRDGRRRGIPVALPGRQPSGHPHGPLNSPDQK